MNEIIQRKIAEYKKHREELLVRVNEQLAFINGEITALENLQKELEQFPAQETVEQPIEG